MNVSFNQKTKEEIIRNTQSYAPCCAGALFSAMLAAQNGVEVNGENIGFIYKTRNRAKWEFFKRITEKVLNDSCVPDVIRRKKTGKDVTEYERAIGNDVKEGEARTQFKITENKGVFSVSLSNAKELLTETGLIGYREGLLDIGGDIPVRYCRCECCAKSYLKGLFLESGAIKTPSGKGYHLEITITSIESALDCIRIFEDIGFTARLIGRQGVNVVYFKEAETICDILALFGASIAVMDINSSFIIGSMRANANRRANCDNANIDKSLTASEKQLKIIGTAPPEALSSLPLPLKEIALLRINNPQSSVSELAQLAGISKSGASHRINKLLKRLSDYNP